MLASRARYPRRKADHRVEDLQRVLDVRSAPLSSFIRALRGCPTYRFQGSELVGKGAQGLGPLRGRRKKVFQLPALRNAPTFKDDSVVAKR